MALSIGIVGLPNVGKSTLFNALTRKQVSAENFPFCTIDPSVGVVAVPDARLEKLANLSKSAQTIPAAVEFVDIAGLVKGAAEGEGLGNQFLAHIRECSAIAQVVRLFDDTDIAHVAGHVDPLDDIEVISLELIMADMQTLARRQDALTKDVRAGDTQTQLEQQVVVRVKHALEAGVPARAVALEEHERHILHELHLLTAKPMLYVLNKKAGGHNLDEELDERFHKLIAWLEMHGEQWVVVDAGVEQELSEVAHEDRQMFRQEFGVLDDGVNDLIRAGYQLLDLISFFTTGEKETRAWQIRRGARAPEAGAAIHSDFRDKFIRAEVIHYSKLIVAGSIASAREQGLLRTEGKEYVVADGDVIEFKI